MSKRDELNTEEAALLREVLERRAPDLADDFTVRAVSGSLAPSERAILREIIGSEIAEHGLDARDEPTPRGLRLERLLDTINRPNITRTLKS